MLAVALLFQSSSKVHARAYASHIQRANTSVFNRACALSAGSFFFLTQLLRTSSGSTSFANHTHPDIMLPTGGIASSSGRWQTQIPEFLRRSVHVDQMEMDSALSQAWQSITNPSIVAKISKARKMTKNHYHRDDPALIVLQGLFILAVTVAFGLATNARFFLILANVLSSFGLYYIAFGAVAASTTWWYANTFLMAGGHLHEIRRDVEWQYAFDIHCNAFCAYFSFTGVLHFILLPVLLSDTFLSQLLSNGLYAAGAVAYLYNTFYGYLELPMLQRQQSFMMPAVLVVGLFVVLTLFTHVNMSKFVVSQWWTD